MRSTAARAPCSLSMRWVVRVLLDAELMSTSVTVTATTAKMTRVTSISTSVKPAEGRRSWDQERRCARMEFTASRKWSR